ncbi:hypothetical protein MRB53_002631 [Persea americana]|uniref:Uncharacterized protein n=1 Tax=Persea americana TaxID=3435 RepID=A0ACC2MVR9_PERAE|nr:hypothetical protein MRB53_002631 [Persea americana]
MNRTSPREFNLGKDLRQKQRTVPFVLLEASAFTITQNPMTVMEKKLRIPLYRPLDARAKGKGDGVPRRKAFEILRRRLVDVKEEFHSSSFDLRVTFNKVAFEFHYINPILRASDFSSKEYDVRFGSRDVHLEVAKNFLIPGLQSGFKGLELLVENELGVSFDEEVPNNCHQTIREGEGPSMIGEGTVKPSSNIGPTLPIIGPGEAATREANVLQARGNEFQSSWGVNGVDAEFFHCRGDHIEVPNNSPWVVVRKGRGTQVEKLTKVKEYEGEALVKNQMEGIAEGWGKLDKKEK